MRRLIIKILETHILIEKEALVTSISGVINKLKGDNVTSHVLLPKKYTAKNNMASKWLELKIVEFRSQLGNQDKLRGE